MRKGRDLNETIFVIKPEPEPIDWNRMGEIVYLSIQATPDRLKVLIASISI